MTNRSVKQCCATITVTALVMANVLSCSAFAPSSRQNIIQIQYETTKPLFVTPMHHHHHGRISSSLYMAGGFEWEDPDENTFDQGVENPYKNPELMKGGTDEESGEQLLIDPGRLLAPRLNGVNLYFIGMMGSGKSSIGDKVARRMGTYNFLDTDDIIEQAAKKTITEIFEEEGEEEFREVEGQILGAVSAYVRCVISTGGGIVTRLQNWAKLESGIVVWLDVEPELILKRVEGNTDRPLLQTEDPLQTLKDLFEQRKEKYEQADVRIEVEEDMTEDMVVDTVIRELHDFIDNNPPKWKLDKAKAQAEGIDWVK